MKTQKESIRKMVGYLNNPEEKGGFWLPNIQRSFVWDEDQIERLFDSIMREYPISTLLVWKTKSKIKHRKFIDNYRNGIKIIDFYIPENDKIKMLVLDGQQRLQSLFIGLKGSYNKKELFFDILSGKKTAPEDIRYIFKFKDSSDSSFPWIKFNELVFNNNKQNRIVKNIIESAPGELTDEEEDVINENVSQIMKTFKMDENVIYQELDSVDNPDCYEDDDVVEIFIRANSGGTPLSKSDLLFSLLVASWEDSDEKMDELLIELNKTGYAFTRDFILKCCLSLLNKGAAYKVEKFRDNSTRDRITQNWDQISSAIKDVKDYLWGKTYIRSDYALTSYLVLMPLIYFRYHYEDKWSSAKNIDEYVLRTSLAGAFSGSPDSLIDRCTREIGLKGDFVASDIFTIIRNAGRNLDISEESIFNLDYNSKRIHLLFNIWYKEFNPIPSYENNKPQIDHIFPQSALKSIKDENPATGARNLLRYKKWDRDQIANCMLLTQEENGAGGKGDTLPQEWFNEKDEKYFDLHLIPKDPELWKLENYDQFIEERKKLIAKKFEYLVLK